MKYKIPLFLKLFIILFVLNVFISMANNSFSQIDKGKTLVSNGEKLFKSNCSGCHSGGKNLIRPEKPIINSQKLMSKANLADFLNLPPPPMPKFKNITSNNKQLDSLYSYLLTLMAD